MMFQFRVEKSYGHFRERQKNVENVIFNIFIISIFLKDLCQNLFTQSMTELDILKRHLME